MSSSSGPIDVRCLKCGISFKYTTTNDGRILHDCLACGSSLVEPVE